MSRLTYLILVLLAVWSHHSVLRADVISVEEMEAGANGVDKKKLEDANQKLYGTALPLGPEKYRARVKRLVDAFPERKNEKGLRKILKDLPKTSDEFDALLNAPNAPLYPYEAEVFGSILRALTYPSLRSETGKMLGALAASVTYDADSPTWLEGCWVTYCVNHPKDFYQTYLDLPKERQKKSLLYLTEGLPGNPRKAQDLLLCSDAAKKARVTGLNQALDSVRAEYLHY